jgi:hypothetical protein
MALMNLCMDRRKPASALTHSQMIHTWTAMAGTSMFLAHIAALLVACMYFTAVRCLKMAFTLFGVRLTFPCRYSWLTLKPPALVT